ncbi:hypothetical protein ACLESO_26220 [Pyxidicoccus sp. 3LG]
MVLFTKPAALACVAALFIGCGGAPVEETATPETLDSAEQSLLYACPWNSSWTRIWYSTTTGLEVGREYCSCDGFHEKYGTTRGRYEQELHSWCS